VGHEVVGADSWDGEQCGIGAELVAEAAFAREDRGGSVAPWHLRCGVSTVAPGEEERVARTQ
jgi:hypothetical protein